MASSFFQDKEGTDKILAILETIEGLASNFESVSPEKQTMYLQGMGLWTEDLQEAIQALGNGTDTTTK
jgi:hypothetical protein